MRKVLNKQHAPAVVLVQLPTVGQAYGEQHPGRGGFARTVEDVYGVFAAYYDTPYLSFRWALEGMLFRQWKRCDVGLAAGSVARRFVGGVGWASGA